MMQTFQKIREKSQGATRLTIAAFAALFGLSVGWPALAHAAPPTLSEYSIVANSQPRSITTGPDGNLWFAERGSSNKIGKITTGGTVTEYSVPTSNAQPWGITTGPDGNLWFTEQIGNKIAKMTTSGTITEYSIPTSNSFPQGIVAGPDGNVWFVEAQGEKVGKITTSGTITEYPLGGSQYPRTIVVGPDGNLWFTEPGTNDIGKITTSGTITEYPIPDTVEPLTIINGSGHDMWFDGNGFIGKITTSGTITDYPVSGTGYMWGLAEGPDGNLWYTDQNDYAVKGVTPSGSVLSTTFTTNGTPRAIMQGPDGNLWFTEGDATGMIGKITFPPKPAITNHISSLTVNGSVVVDVLSGVSGDPDPSTLRIIAGPYHGRAVDPPGTITYTPNKGYVGQDSLVYQVCSLDDASICAQATLNFNILAASASTTKAPDTGFAAGGKATRWTLPATVLITASLGTIGLGARRLRAKAK